MLDPDTQRARSLPEVDLAHLVEEVTGERPIINHLIRDLAGHRVAESDAALPRVLLSFEGDSRAWHVQPSRMHGDLSKDIDTDELHWITRRLPIRWVRTQPERLRRPIAVAYERALARLPTVPDEFRAAATRVV